MIVSLKDCVIGRVPAIPGRAYALLGPAIHTTLVLGSCTVIFIQEKDIHNNICEQRSAEGFAYNAHFT